MKEEELKMSLGVWQDEETNEPNVVLALGDTKVGMDLDAALNLFEALYNLLEDLHAFEDDEECDCEECACREKPVCH